MWHCPNPCCLGPGQAYARKNLESYREVNKAKHTIDIEELFEVGLKKVVELGDTAIATQAFVCVARTCLGI